MANGPVPGIGRSPLDVDRAVHVVDRPILVVDWTAPTEDGMIPVVDRPNLPVDGTALVVDGMDPAADGP